jgi:hypothetical protein
LDPGGGRRRVIPTARLNGEIAVFQSLRPPMNSRPAP